MNLGERQNRKIRIKVSQHRQDIWDITRYAICTAIRFNLSDKVTNRLRVVLPNIMRID